MNNPVQGVSVVIPVFNGAATIARAIEAVQNQTFAGRVELIVVDDGSADETAAVVKQYSRVCYIYQDNAGPAAARNRGVRAAAEEFVCFTDADCVPEPCWIERLTEFFTEPKIAVVSGSYEIFNKDSLLARSIFQEIRYRHQRLMPDFPKSFGSYNFCVRKNIFEAVGGFDRSYRFASGEDNDLSYKILRAGFKICFAKDANVAHVFPDSFQRYMREQYRHGFWRVKIYLDHPAMAAGDDYTFWKDIVEPALVLAIAGSIVLYFTKGSLGKSLSLFFAALLAWIEFFYAWLMNPRWPEKLCSFCIMTARAMARTFGFCAGFFAFSPQKIRKKIK